MNDNKAVIFKIILGTLVAWYCSHAFGLKPLSQNYSAIKPELVRWHTQTTASSWYGYEIEAARGGLSVKRFPVSWDFFIEIVIFLSGCLAFIRMETTESNSRNIVLIVKSLTASVMLVAAGIIVESLESSTTVLPGNSLLVWLGVLTFVGRLLLFLPMRKATILLPVGLLFLAIHWTIVQYSFAAEDITENEKSTEQSEVVEQDDEKSVWDYESGVLDRMAAALNRLLPMSVRNSGLDGEYKNYSEVNFVAYIGVYLLGMAAAALWLNASSASRTMINLVIISSSFISLSGAFQLLGLPAVPRLASPTHILLACGIVFGLLAIAVVFMKIKHAEKVCFPLIALGGLSALLYILERACGVVFRTEVDKHLEPILEPIFGDSWLKWEPIVFYNLVFLIFAAGCIYLYKKRVNFSL
ncbi:MAG: hypothetical protein CMJ76_09425 [Planctomycetaceae bacterium]|nr:hypothetical protein [Planctomycetaceae bacterium]